MLENMNISVNGNSQVPPGFRFHPTEDELLQYYLRKKVQNEQIQMNVIRDLDLNKVEPWDIQEKCKIGTASQNDWYFFSHKEKKYPTGKRTNRATTTGFWKATGRDRSIRTDGRVVGMRKTLVFYKGRAPRGEKSIWIIHEYRLNRETSHTNIEAKEEGGWVVCRLFMKKNHRKVINVLNHSYTSISKNIKIIANNSTRDNSLDYTGRSFKTETMILSPYTNLSSMNQYSCPISQNGYHSAAIPKIEVAIRNNQMNITGWSTIDQLISSQLDLSAIQSPNNERFDYLGVGEYNNEMDSWPFDTTSSSLSSSSNPLCHV